LDRRASVNSVAPRCEGIPAAATSSLRAELGSLPRTLRGVDHRRLQVGGCGTFDSAAAACNCPAAHCSAQPDRADETGTYQMIMVVT